jgi:hypothetical protein
MPGAVPGVTNAAKGFAVEAVKNGAMDLAKTAGIEGFKNVASGAGGLLAGTPGVAVPIVPSAAPSAAAPSAAATGVKDLATKTVLPSVVAGPASGAGAVTPLTGGTATIPTGAGGLLSNPLLASQLLGGVASAFAPNDAKAAAKAREQAEQDMGYYAYGGGDPDGKGPGGMLPGIYSSNPNPLGAKPYGAPPTIAPGYTPRTTRWQWDPSKSTIVEVPA